MTVPCIHCGSEEGTFSYNSDTKITRCCSCGNKMSVEKFKVRHAVYKIERESLTKPEPLAKL